jgi:hypothetical protein
VVAPPKSSKPGSSEIRSSPSEEGTLHLNVRRPSVDEREVRDAGALSIEDALVGDDSFTS